MPWFLRKIKSSRWTGDLPKWIPQGDVDADKLKDLATTKCELSVWVINDEKSNLDQIITALAATVEKVSHIDFVLVEEGLVTGSGFKIEEADGESPLTGVSKSHRHIVELTASKVALLASVLHNNGKIDRRDQVLVMGLLADAHRKGEIETERLKPGLLEQIAK